MPICFALEHDTLFSAVDGKPKRSKQLKRLDNIQRDPRVSVIVDRFSEDWSRLWWVLAEGEARVADERAEREQALQLLCAKYEQYAEAPPDGAVIAVEIGRWKSWAATPGDYSY